MTSSLRVTENAVENRFACAENVFASFLEVAPDAVVIADRDGLIVRVNAQTEKMFQYTRAELLGRKI